jgi:hypothetical protein
MTTPISFTSLQSIVSQSGGMNFGSLIQTALMNSIATTVITPPRPSVTSPPTTSSSTKPPTSIITSSTYVSVTKSPGLKRALLIGVNYYGTTLQLNGCINDTNNMASLLGTYFPNCEIKTLNDSATVPANAASVPNFPTGQNIVDGINWLINGLKDGEHVFLHYSGHGTLIADINGDEINGTKGDSCIVGLDIKTGPDSKKLYQLQLLTDDYLRAYLANRIPKNSRCFALFDACNSGTAMDLRYNYVDISPSLVPTLTENSIYNDTIGNVIFLSGSTDTGSSYELTTSVQGALTYYFIEAWNTLCSNPKTTTVDLKRLYQLIRTNLPSASYDQTPQLSAGRTDTINNPFIL